MCLAWLRQPPVTGSVQSIAPWARGLAEPGLDWPGARVVAPRLPGHGTHWRDLARTRWWDWYGAVEDAYHELSGQCGTVYVAGLSMGGALALRLAEHYSDDVRGLILVNPALQGNPNLALVPLAKHLVRTTDSIGSSINKPDVTEHAYPRTPLRAVARRSARTPCRPPSSPSRPCSAATAPTA